MSDSSVPEIRLSDTERDQVVEQLNLAMTEGRLDVTEFEDRTRLVYAAKVPSDLEGVLTGLPVTPAVVSVAPSQAPAAATPGSDRNRWFFSLIGDRKQRGDLDMGDKSTSISVLGDTTFDLTQVTAPTVDLQVFTLIGDVTIVVRRGTRVRSNIVVLIGDRNETDTGPADPNGMGLRLRVVSLIGDVDVRVVEA